MGDRGDPGEPAVRAGAGAARPREHYASLPTAAREQLDARIEQLLENPRQHPGSAYDDATDQWTTTYGGGAGLIVYAVVHDPCG